MLRVLGSGLRVKGSEFGVFQNVYEKLELRSLHEMSRVMAHSIDILDFNWVCARQLN